MTDDRIAAARASLERHAWRDAFDLYREAEAAGGTLDPDDLDRLAGAAWWLSKADECLDARERSYAAYSARGDHRRAAYEAVWLTRDNMIRRRNAIAMGWLKRAESLLDGLSDSVEHAYLALMQSGVAASRGDLEAAASLAARAVELGATFGDRDIAARALSNQAEALVLLGRVDEGLALLDEAIIAAVGGELGPMATGIVYCNAISVCAGMADFGRAGEFTEASKRWCERQSISGFPGVCRVYRAEVVRLRGAWAEAEREARVAAEELAQHGIAIYVGLALKELGEIRLRMGDLASAEEALRQAHEAGEDPQPALALVRLAAGDREAAWSQIRRALSEDRPSLPRARLIPAAVDIALAVGQVGAAREAADELADTAAHYGSAMLAAAAASAQAAVLLAEGSVGEALARARDGLRLWRGLEAPYEAARAQELLARAYREAGDDEAARLELSAALSTFERLGAAIDARRLASALGVHQRVHKVTRTFMFTDIVGSTSFIEAVGDDAWHDVRAWHDAVLRAAFAAHDGEVVDHAGDGFFVAFPDPQPALACAVAIQRLLAEHRRTHGFAPKVRVGLHADEATRTDTTYEGRSVHLAARVGAVAKGDEILATETTLALTSSRWPTSGGRDAELSGLKGKVRLVSIDWRPTAEDATATGPTPDHGGVAAGGTIQR
jgi:class 3 adenylate cyclase